MKKFLLFLVCLWLFPSSVSAQDAASKKEAEDENRQILKNMQAGGFDFSKPHLVDFFAIFPAKKQADTVANLYNKEKTTRKELKAVQVHRDENGDYELSVQVLMQVSYDNVTNFEKKMLARANAQKGKFNGWGVFQ